MAGGDPRRLGLLLAELAPEAGEVLRPLREEDFPQLLQLYQSNGYYNSLALEGPPTLATCREDMTALPPGTEPEQKLFLGLFQGEELEAVLDLVGGYPDPATLYLGLLELRGSAQGRGLGTRVMARLLAAGTGAGFARMRLACFRKNQPGMAFWTGLGFREEGQVDRAGKELVKLVKDLDPAPDR